MSPVLIQHGNHIVSVEAFDENNEIHILGYVLNNIISFFRLHLVEMIKIDANDLIPNLLQFPECQHLHVTDPYTITMIPFPGTLTDLLINLLNPGPDCSASRT
jgi:hypothetical protein